MAGPGPGGAGSERYVLARGIVHFGLDFALAAKIAAAATIGGPAERSPSAPVVSRRSFRERRNGPSLREKVGMRGSKRKKSLIFNSLTLTLSQGERE
jgi:hypothetical protein